MTKWSGPDRRKNCQDCLHAEDIIEAVKTMISEHEQNEVHSMDKAADKIADKVLERLGVDVSDKVTLGEALQIVKWLKKALGTLVMSIGAYVLFLLAKFIAERHGG